MAKREFLQLAKPYQPMKHDIKGWYASEKLDGMRCFWDGGITIGRPATEVPWANTTKDKRQHRSTGLWSRHGKVIHAPIEWVNCLPMGLMLDGELYAGPGTFQTLMSVCKRFDPVAEQWAKVSFVAFEAPTIYNLLDDGKLSWTKLDGAAYWAMARWKEVFDTKPPTARREFLDSLSLMYEHYTGGGHIWRPITYEKVQNLEDVDDLLDKITQHQGEGVMLRDPKTIWTPARVGSILKYKPYLDAEGVVVGYISARKGKIQGKLGALLVKFNNVVFELSGYTDEERAMNNDVWCWENPGKTCIDGVESLYFPLGSTICFKYRELSDMGIPKEARYWRKYVK